MRYKQIRGAEYADAFVDICYADEVKSLPDFIR